MDDRTRSEFFIIINAHLVNLIRSSNCATATAPIVNFTGFCYPVIFVHIKRSFLLRNTDYAKTLSVELEGLIRKLQMSISFAVNKLLDRGVVNVIAARNPTWIALAVTQVVYAYEDMRRTKPPRIAESQNIFQQFRLVLVVGPAEGVLIPLKIEFGTFTL